MAKAVFLGLPLHGHTNPSLPVVRALVERGDEVVYFSNDGFAGRIEQAGARYRPYRNAFLADPRPLAEQSDAMSWLLMRTTAEVLAGELDAIRAERPDYIISDSVAPWGQWVAQILGVPVVTSVTTFAVNRYVMAFAASQGNRPTSASRALSKIRYVAKASWLGRRLRREYGVAGTGIVGLMFGSSGLNIVYTSREFQPRAETFDDRFLFVGPAIGRRDAALPGDSVLWDQPPPVPLVYVSLGTLFNADPTFYRHCFEAFRHDEVRVVMSIPDTLTAATLGPTPSNVVVRSWIPQLDVLQRAAVFISHGGMNSVSESLHHGVPLVVVPQMGEQELVARQVERLGAGVFLPKKEVTADRLRRAVHRVRHDDRFRQQAAVLRRSFDASGGAERAADAILTFTRRGTPSSGGAPAAGS